ncbi:MAG: ATP-binding protein [Acidobacteriota bacterium]
MPSAKTPEIERERTDESLRAEREKADFALLERQAAVETDADMVVLHAREQADALLIAARERADEKLEETARAPKTASIIAEERVLQDEALREEREAADEVLERERAASARARWLLAPLERDKTDRYLLTERARADDALANRDDFLGIVSHDLRNLLGGIAVSAEQLSACAVQGIERKETLLETARIQRYCTRMDRLIGDLVDVASIDAGRLAIAFSRGDWSALVSEALDMFTAAATAKGLSLQSEIVGDPTVAEFDHDRMLQVLANLLSNSIKFTAAGGQIRIRVERIADEIRVSIHDTGVGIPATMLEAVFERFWQVGKNDQRGVGLGLYISRCIVEAHRGKIWAESEAGQGSTFRFTLPVSLSAGVVRPDEPGDLTRSSAPN